MSEQGYKDFVKRLTDVCEKYSDKTAITYMRNDGSKTLFTFGEIFKQIKAAKEKFEKIGLQKGDRVAIIAPLSPFSVFTLFSLAYANITAVLIDASLPPQEIDRLLTYSDVRSVFTVPAIFEALDETVCNDIPVFDLTKEDGEYQLFPNAPDKVSRPPTTDPGMDVFVMIFSSGTTSEMKGIMHTYTAILSGLELNWKIADVSHESMYLHILPISHLAGLDCILTFFFCGSNIGMVEEMTAAKLPTSLTNYKPTHFVVVPRVFEVIEQKIRQEVRSKGALVSGVFSLLLGVSHFFRKKLGLNVGKVLCKSIRKKVFGENIFAIGAGGAIAKGSMVSFFLDLGVKIWADFYALSETGVPTVATGVFDRYPAGTQGNVNRFDGIKIKIHAPDESGIGEVRI
ncbi:MAG: AMP-binding protein, partial [Oscillospiraceae bacterium]|nr:AMP-binding protein [Oscillospiraceae bacterium]